MTIHILLYEGLETKWGNNGYSPWGGEVIKRGPLDVKEYIGGSDIGYPAERKDIIRFAEGKQAESNVLDLLRGIPEIEYNTPDESY